MPQILVSLLWLLCLFGLFRSTLPLKQYPTLLFPSKTSPWSYTRTQNSKNIWEDEKPLCIYTSHNYTLPVDLKADSLSDIYTRSLKRDLASQLTQISHYDNYLKPQNQIESSKSIQNLASLLLPKFHPPSLYHRPQNTLTIQWKQNNHVLYTQIENCPFPIENDLQNPFQYNCILWVKNSKHSYFPQTHALTKEQRYQLQNILRRSTCPLHLKDGLYEICVE